MIKIVINKIEARAYVFDIVCVCQMIEQVHKSILRAQMVGYQWYDNKYTKVRHNENSQRKRKIKGFKNELNKPDINSKLISGHLDK